MLHKLLLFFQLFLSHLWDRRVPICCQNSSSLLLCWILFLLFLLISCSINHSLTRFFFFYTILMPSPHPIHTQKIKAFFKLVTSPSCCLIFFLLAFMSNKIYTLDSHSVIFFFQWSFALTLQPWHCYLVPFWNFYFPVVFWLNFDFLFLL